MKEIGGHTRFQLRKVDPSEILEIRKNLGAPDNASLFPPHFLAKTFLINGGLAYEVVGANKKGGEKNDNWKRNKVN